MPHMPSARSHYPVRGPAFNQSVLFDSGSGAACYTSPQPAGLPAAGVPVSGCTASYSVQFPRASYQETFSGSATSFTVSRQEAGQSFQLIVGFVPEPSTWALMLAGFGMVGYSRWRRSVGHHAVTIAG